MWYQRKGETIVRELAASVSNPRTEAQQDQRVQLANMVHMYQANRFWMDKYSFETKKKTWSDYNAFVSANAGIVGYYLTKEMSAAGACIAGPYKVSDGSLPRVVVNYDSAEECFYTDLYLSIALDSDNTIGQLSASLLEYNNGLRDGDQLSFIVNYQRTGDIPVVVARAYELILNSQDSRTLESMGLGMLGSDEYVQGSDLKSLTFFPGTGADMSAFTCVVSRTQSGNTKVSTQTLVQAGGLVSYSNNWTGAAARQRARASYGQSSEAFLDSTYYSNEASNQEVPIPIEFVSLNGQTDGDSITINRSGDWNVEILASSELLEENFEAVRITGHSWVNNNWTTFEIENLPASCRVQGNKITTTFEFDNAYNVVETCVIAYDSLLYTLTFEQYNPDVHP